MTFDRRRHVRAAGLFITPERWRWKNTPQPPAPPNPVATANAQTGSNIGTAVANSALGNVNQVSPYGSTTFNKTGGYTDPTTGLFVPSYTETSSLNPTLAGILSGTESAASSLVPTAEALATRAGTTATTPLNPAGANQNIIAGGPQALDTNATNAIYSGETAFLDPQWQQQQKDLEDQLARQGIPVGSDAYNNAMQQFQTSKSQAYQGARGQAASQGITSANNMYNLALLGQQQQLGQQQTLQTNPLSVLSAIYGGAGPMSPNATA